MADNGTEALAAEYEHEEEVHDRRYQAYSLRHQISLEPVDSEEGDRLRLENEIFKLIFAARPNNTDHPNNPIIARIRQIPRRILDCGCGDGSWAIDVATRLPQSEVIGVDISPILAYEIPSDLENCRAEVCDLNRDLRTFPDNFFDLVHSRLIAGGIGATRWQRYVNDIRAVLRSGGLLQMFEFDFLFQSDNGSFNSNTALTRWSIAYRHGLEASQSPTGKKDSRVVGRIGTMLSSARFSNIRQQVIRVPLSGWHSDPAWRRIGQRMQENTHLLLESLGLYPITQRLGLPLGSFEEMVAHARNELRDLTLKPYMSLYVWTAEKPS